MLDELAVDQNLANGRYAAGVFDPNGVFLRYLDYIPATVSELNVLREGMTAYTAREEFSGVLQIIATVIFYGAPRSFSE